MRLSLIFCGASVLLAPAHAQGLLGGLTTSCPPGTKRNYLMQCVPISGTSTDLVGIVVDPFINVVPNLITALFPGLAPILDPFLNIIPNLLAPILTPFLGPIMDKINLVVGVANPIINIIPNLVVELFPTLLPPVDFRRFKSSSESIANLTADALNSTAVQAAALDVVSLVGAALKVAKLNVTVTESIRRRKPVSEAMIRQGTIDLAELIRAAVHVAQLNETLINDAMNAAQSNETTEETTEETNEETTEEVIFPDLENSLNETVGEEETVDGTEELVDPESIDSAEEVGDEEPFDIIVEKPKFRNVNTASEEYYDCPGGLVWSPKLRYCVDSSVSAR